MKHTWFVDVAGPTIERLYVLAAKGEPGEWCAIYRHSVDTMELLREFRGKWIVSIDSSSSQDLVAISDDGWFYSYTNGKWIDKDLGYLFGLTKVRCRPTSAIIIGAFGYVARFDGEVVSRTNLRSRSRLLGLLCQSDDKQVVVGENGFFAYIRDDRVVETRIAGIDRGCDLVEDGGGGYWISASGAKLARGADKDWKIVAPPNVNGTITSIARNIETNRLLFVSSGRLWDFDPHSNTAEPVSSLLTQYICCLRHLPDGSLVATGRDEGLFVL